MTNPQTILKTHAPGRIRGAVTLFFTGLFFTGLVGMTGLCNTKLSATTLEHSQQSISETAVSKQLNSSTECRYLSLFELLSVTDDLSRSLRQIHLFARYHENELAGYQVEHVASNSLFQEHGLKVGDFITTLNNIALSEQSLWANEIRLLPQLEEFSVQIKRQDQLIMLRYIIGGNLQCM